MTNVELEPAMSARVWVCSVCWATAAGDPTGRGCGLPRGWEHHDPKACPECVWCGQRPPREAARPVCGECVLAAINRLLAALAATPGRGGPTPA